MQLENCSFIEITILVLPCNQQKVLMEAFCSKYPQKVLFWSIQALGAVVLLCLFPFI